MISSPRWSDSEEFCWGDDSSGTNSNSDTDAGNDHSDSDAESYEEKRLKDCLKDIANRSERLLHILKIYSEDPTKDSISGINKLKHKIEREVLNAMQCLSALEEMSNARKNSIDSIITEQDIIEWNRCTAKAKLISQCTGIATLEMCVVLVITEPEVCSVCTPFMLPFQTMSESSKDAHFLKLKNRSSAEVDIVSCRGRRWIKVRGAKHREDTDGSEEHRFSQMINGLMEASSYRYVPFQQKPQLYIVFSNASSSLLQLLDRMSCLYYLLSPQSYSSLLNHFSGELSNITPVLPLLQLDPYFLCWDTTALVAFCSESCYASFNWTREERLLALEPFKVLKEQQRKELMDDEDCERAVHDFIHSYLEQFTKEMTLNELKQKIKAQIYNHMQQLPEVSSELMEQELYCYYPDLTWLRDLLQGQELPADRSHYWDDTKWLSSDWTGALELHSLRKDVNHPEDHEIVRNWVMADVSYTEFKWMIETIAGSNECHRALELLQHCVVVSTSFLEKVFTLSRKGGATLLNKVQAEEQHKISVPAVPYPNSDDWYSNNTISLRNKVVFGMGDALRAVTLTSNKQVWSKLLDKGVSLAVALHPSRALTELKFSKQQRRAGSKVPPEVQWFDSGN